MFCQVICEMETIQPTFPALHVHEDDSVGSLRSLADWTHDVDQWFWSGPGDYLIDSTGLKFVQECERAPDSRPVDVPTWRFDSKMDEALIRSLLESELGEDPLKQGQTGDSVERIRAMIDRMVEHDAQ